MRLQEAIKLEKLEVSIDALFYLFKNKTIQAFTELYKIINDLLQSS